MCAQIFQFNLILWFNTCRPLGSQHFMGLIRHTYNSVTMLESYYSYISLFFAEVVLYPFKTEYKGPNIDDGYLPPKYIDKGIPYFGKIYHVIQVSLRVSSTSEVTQMMVLLSKEFNIRESPPISTL